MGAASFSVGPVVEAPGGYHVRDETNGPSSDLAAAEVMERRRDLHGLTRTIEAQEEELLWRAQNLAEREQEILQLQWTEAGLRREILRLERHVAIIEQSRSFVLTAPLRRVAALRQAALELTNTMSARFRHRVALLRDRSVGPTVASAVHDVTTLLPRKKDVGDQDPAIATSPPRPVTVAAEERMAMLAHPPCLLSYRFTVPARAFCRVYVALLPEVWERVIDGVEFRLTAANVDGGEVATSCFVSNPGRLPHHRRWKELNLSLAQFVGLEIVLSLRTNVPDDEFAHFAWALWGDPAIVCDDVVVHHLSCSGATGMDRGSTADWNGTHPSRALSNPAHSLALRDEYQRWIVLNEPDEAAMRTMAARQRSWSFRPKVSVVVPVFRPAPEHLAQAIKSVSGQIYDNWELCMVDGGSGDASVRQVLEEAAASDARVKVTYLGENRGVAMNTNAALSLASGEFVAFLDHDDQLARFALYEVVEAINERSEIDFVYSDEDKIGALSGAERHSPHFKPAWSPHTFLSHNYINHFTVIRKTLLDAVGGLRDGLDGSQDYDLYLRVLARTDEIAHIPKVLYHWRAVPGSAASDILAKPHAFNAAKRAIQTHLDRHGIEAAATDGKFIGSYRVRYAVPPRARVSRSSSQLGTVLTCSARASSRSFKK